MAWAILLGFAFVGIVALIIVGPFLVLAALVLRLKKSRSTGRFDSDKRRPD